MLSLLGPISIRFRAERCRTCGERWIEVRSSGITVMSICVSCIPEGVDWFSQEVIRGG